MIKLRRGDVLAVEKGIIVHGCNCLGVMGGGIAASVRERFPTAYKAYKEQERYDGLRLGNISYVNVTEEKVIVNALTQRVFYPHAADFADNRYTSYDAVAECFEKVRDLAFSYKRRDMTLGVMFPLIGSVRGGGNWEIISRIIDQTIPDEFEKVVYLFD